MPLSTDHLARCILALERSLEALRKSEAGSIEYEVYRNAAVKGFELALETAGKLLRKALKAYFATPKAADALTFRDVFRHAAKHGVITLDETERWLRYRDNRNDTAHDYGEGFAGETLALMPGFLADAKALAERLRHAGGS